jgi:hypothetical protein
MVIVMPHTAGAPAVWQVSCAQAGAVKSMSKVQQKIANNTFFAEVETTTGIRSFFIG